MASEVVEEFVTILGYELDDQGKLKRYNDGLDKTDKRANKLASTMGRLAGAIATGAAFEVGRRSFVQFAGFERQMARIGLAAGSTADETKGASEDILTMANNFALSREEAALGLDTLVASGQSLEQAMSFLPSVLATAQASGAAVDDIANTAQKVSSALGIMGQDMQQAFDIMVVGGEAGQFELRDMAQFIPDLANLFSGLGNSGEEGLKQLISLLQTVREDTGSSAAAATQLRNVFSKIDSQETAKRFSEFGINLTEELKLAKENGEGAVNAFVRLSRQAVGDDLSKLALLFRDQELRLGMQSLVTSADSLAKFYDEVDGSNVDGKVLKNLNVILSDNQAKIDKMAQSWDRFKLSIGAGLSDVVGPALEGANTFFNRSFNQDSIRDEQRQIEQKNGFNPTIADGFGDAGLDLRAAKRILTEGGSQDGISNLLATELPTVAKVRALKSFGGDFGDGFSPDFVNADLSAVIENLKRLDSASALQQSTQTNNVDNSSNVTNVNIDQTVTNPTDAPTQLANASADAISKTSSTRPSLFTGLANL